MSSALLVIVGDGVAFGMGVVCGINLLAWSQKKMMLRILKGMEKEGLTFEDIEGMKVSIRVKEIKEDEEDKTDE